jgi:NADPH-dependent glutamate synthase beta subunit-like oxidoreductase
VVFELPAAERAEGFTETVIGLSAAEALDESGRCLRCDIRDHH